MSPTTEKFNARRRWFDALAPRIAQDSALSAALSWLQPVELHSCPCCGYGTLPTRGDFVICNLCDWEDDGQDDADADQIRGGPNGGYSLTDARVNFLRSLVMYAAPELARVLAAPLHADRVAVKRQLLALYDAMPLARDGDLAGLWRRVLEANQVLRALNMNASQTNVAAADDVSRE